MKTVFRIAIASAVLLFGAPLGPALAQDAQPAGAAQELQQPLDEQQPLVVQSESDMKATEIGVRFTPRMAYAVSNAFAKQMKDRYELNDQQVSDVKQIIATRLMKTVSDNAEAGRNAVEMMMENAIENDGRFNKESAQQFAKQVKPLVPAFRDFFVQTAGDIGKKMSVKQRLKFTADVAAATAGFAVFENRMARWEEGKAGENANPFRDEPETDPAKTVPVDPNETADHREVRQTAENQLRWELDVESRWSTYVDQAIAFYDFDEAQTNSAKSILKDILDRARAVKTPEWQKMVMENRIAQNMSWRAGGGEFAQGPVMFRLESQRDQLTKPLFDLAKQLKSRIEDLPTSAQRAKAMENVKKKFAEKGMNRVPL
ncbi:MAG TPA: hypothetical protein VMV94_13900 [Phycisphaerae bacterium]|nr:hypothetical protein [Phycisphaerae bacterium]